MLLLVRLSPQCCTHSSSLARFAVRCLVVSWLRQLGSACPFTSARPVFAPLFGTGHGAFCGLAYRAVMPPRAMLLFLENWDAALFAWHEPLARIAVLCHCAARLGVCSPVCSLLVVAPSVRGFAGVRSRLAGCLHPDPCASTLPHDDSVAFADRLVSAMTVSFGSPRCPIAEMPAWWAYLVFLHCLAVSLVRVSL